MRVCLEAWACVMQAVVCADAAERDADAALCGGAPAVRAPPGAHEQRGLLVG